MLSRAEEPFKGRWDIPGGFLDEGEHPLDGIRRELREETGLEVEPVEFLGVWMDRYGGDSTAEATLNLYWTARVIGGEPAGCRRRLRAAVVRSGRASAARTSSRSRTYRSSSQPGARGTSTRSAPGSIDSSSGVSSSTGSPSTAAWSFPGRASIVKRSPLRSSQALGSQPFAA